MTDDREEALLRSAALRNAAAIQQARERVERELRDARDELRRAAAERERLLAAEQWARAEAERVSRMKDEFLATLSHELRTPLSAILGWTQVLKRKTTDPEIAQALEVIERNTRAQAQLIDDLLDMSRITAGKIRLDAQPVLPIEVVRAAIETVTPAAEAKALRLEAALDPVAGPVYGDPGRLQQVVWNLLSNAIKFTPRGGRVRVGAASGRSRASRSASPTPASASGRSSSPTSSSASARPTLPRRAATAASGSGSRSSSTWSSCTAARCRRRAPARAGARPSASGCRWRRSA